MRPNWPKLVSLAKKTSYFSCFFFFFCFFFLFFCFFFFFSLLKYSLLSKVIPFQNLFTESVH